MTNATRRGFLAITGAGVATAAVAPSAFAAGSTSAGADTTADASASGHVVAFVSDASKGEVTVMKGASEVVVHDASLVRAINRHASKMGK